MEKLLTASEITTLRAARTNQGVQGYAIIGIIISLLLRFIIFKFITPGSNLSRAITKVFYRLVFFLANQTRAKLIFVAVHNLILEFKDLLTDDAVANALVIFKVPETKAIKIRAWIKELLSMPPIEDYNWETVFINNSGGLSIMSSAFGQTILVHELERSRDSIMI